MKSWAIVLASVTMAACGKPAPQPETPAVGNEQGYLAKVTALPDGQLRGVLYRAIVDGTGTCPQVTAATREADQNGRAAWSATCADGSRWMVAIGDDGVAQARPIPKAR